MRRTVTLTAALALLVASTGGALAAASSSDEEGSNERDGRGGRIQVLHVTRTTGNDVILDLDHSATAAHPAPDSIGDEDVFTADFYIGDTKVGFDGGVCKLVRQPAFYHCIATNSFAKGDLTVQFLADFTQTAPGHFAITGGTGAYRGASGEVTYVDHPDPQRDDVTFRFTTR
jgi:allene oxide cyclase-like protein